MKLRSLLYVPGNSERFIAKAHERGADAIIIDLEDSVPSGSKTAARDALTDTVRRVGKMGAAVFVRINSEVDMQVEDAVAACNAGAFGIVVPMVTNVDRLNHLATELETIERSLGRDRMPFIGLVEDAGAVLDAREIASHPRVIGVALGSEDFAMALGAEPTADVLRTPKLLVHLAAKACGKRSFGLLRSIADYADIEAMQSAVAEAKAFGFDGATCIHPSTVPVLNTGFSPSETALEWARRLLPEAEKAARDNRGSFVFEGRMVDAPVIARARALLGAVVSD